MTNALSGTVRITGHTSYMLAAALREVAAKLEGGFTSGADSNDTSGYSFDVKGEEVEYYAIAVAGDFEQLRPERFRMLFEAQEARAEGDLVAGVNEANHIVWKSDF